ncbi:MAG TPA: toxin TcdB middle/C-terminal domain-containing protein, partial [Myxococcota bacterium]|nr:toxin TcdB middle/C-terminal domain-containing protein [Myxococcota bacterium]
DSAEREFRGFGKVEQWDTESLGTYEATGRGAEAALDLDPVRTVSWFHTGAWRQQGTLESAYEAEYWSEDEADWPTENAKEDAPVSGASWPAWKVAERWEAARALKGKLLRQELYAEDGSESASLPYAVTATTWTVARLQPLGSSEHACFTTIARESLARHYERVTADPRSTHELTLSYDSYGTVTKKASVGYPRRDVEDRREEQNALTVMIAESTSVNDDSSMDTETDPAAMHWHVGVATRSTGWHLTNTAWQASGSWNYTDLARFSATILTAALDAATEIPFEQSAASGAEKRAISIEATLYWKDDLSGPADVGTMESRALPCQVYRKTVTTGLASDIFPSVPDNAAFEAAGYVELEEDGDWWVASGTATPDPAKFYQATELTDPFGNSTTLSYDAWSLFVLSATDALGNSIIVAMDPAALQPSAVTDANGNITEARYDALGRVIAVAVEGDVLETAPTVATSYELGRWAASALPARTVTTQRTEHGGSEFLYRYSYSDGGGKLVQEKVSAEDGEVPGETGTISPRWVGTGRTVLNNKELPVKQYEPFFSAT